MGRYIYRPRPSVDPRSDCVRAGWRTVEDITPDEAQVNHDALNELSSRVLGSIAVDHYSGVYASIFSRVIFDYDTTPEGEELFLAQTLGQNTVLYMEKNNSD